jgi:NAD(P)H dehydrogenase (quinone)
MNVPSSARIVIAAGLAILLAACSTPGARAVKTAGPLPGRIIVTGASGGLAGETIQVLLERGVRPADLILVSRTPEKLGDLAARGASVRRGDFDEPASLPAAFAGGERMLLISTSGGADRVVQHRAAIDAARHAGVRHVVYTSVVSPTADNPWSIVRDHRLTEEALRASHLKWTMLRNQIYMDAATRDAARVIASGEYVTNAGDGRIAYVDRRDCAAAAAAVLTTPGHAGKAYDITGPDLLSPAEYVALLAELSGRPVRVVPIGDDDLFKSVNTGGLPEPIAHMIVGMGTAQRLGFFNVKSSAVEKLTGEPARTLRAKLLADPLFAPR